MRIAHLTTDGREVLRDYGSSTPALGTAPQALFEGFATVGGVEVHVISCVQQPVSSPPKLADNVWFHSLNVPKIGWLRTGYQGCIRAVRRKLRELRPDLVHGQGTERECGWCAVWSGYPNVLTIHGNMSEMAKVFRAGPGSFLWCTALLEKYVLMRTGGVFCNSAFTRSLVGGRARKTWLVPNAVREGFFSVPRRPRAASKPVLLNIGVITQNKRQAEILQVADRLHRRGLRFEFRFVGQADPNDAYARRFLTDVALESRKDYACFHGLRLGRDLIEGYDEALALVHFPKVETFGLVVAEALARGLKVFAARTGGLVDVLAGHPAAELFATDDLQTLENAIADWLIKGAQPDETSCSIVRDRYHPAVVARRHLEIYRDLLGKRS